MTIACCTEPSALRAQVAAWRAAGHSVGLVPTMGALHAGHGRLIEVSRQHAARTIVTIFVNPTQFAPGEDFNAYPRTFEADRASVAAAGGDLVYAPTVAAMYPDGFATTINVGGPATAGLEDRFRPSHFAGVATIVAKLLLQSAPDIAFFGDKDFQQLRVIERAVRDLDLAVDVRGVPIVREADGLALSSRNVYLQPEERAKAPRLHEALRHAARAITGGAPAEPTLAHACATIAAAGFRIDYVEARRSRDLAAFVPGEPGRILAAAWLGRTRLIDNVAIGEETDNRPALPLA